jgi:hypothetical protein
MLWCTERRAPAQELGLGRLGAKLAALLLAFVAIPAAAQTAETVEGLGPADSDWELEYVGQFGDANGSSDNRQHSGPSFRAVSRG